MKTININPGYRPLAGKQRKFHKDRHKYFARLISAGTGSGKTIAAQRLAGKYNKTTIMLVDNHEKAMEVYNEWKNYNNPVISFMVSRIYKCTPIMKQAISEILNIDFKDDYVCNTCNYDINILELREKGYIEKQHCWNCDFRKNNECIYYNLKEHCQKIRQFKENRLIILVKSYLFTPFINDLLQKHKPITCGDQRPTPL